MVVYSVSANTKQRGIKENLCVIDKTLGHSEYNIFNVGTITTIFKKGK